MARICSRMGGGPGCDFILSVIEPSMLWRCEYAYSCVHRRKLPDLSFVKMTVIYL